jgi:hypothetical protein
MLLKVGYSWWYVPFEAGLCKSWRSYLKNKLRKKRTGFMAQMIEHLPNKHKTPSSMPSTVKRKRIT